MLPRDRRIHTTEQFDRIWQDGKSRYGDLLGIRWMSAEDIRAGFLVGKKVSLKATVRNQVRRRLRAIAAEHLDQLPDGTWLLVVAQPPSAGKEQSELDAEFKSLLQQAELLS